MAKDLEFDHIKEIKGPFYDNKGNKYSHLFGLRSDNMSGGLLTREKYETYQKIKTEISELREIQDDIKLIRREIENLRNKGMNTTAKEQELQEKVSQYGTVQEVQNKMTLKEKEIQTIFGKLEKPHSIPKQATARELLSQFPPTNMDVVRKEAIISSKRATVIFKGEDNYKHYLDLIEEYKEAVQDYEEGIKLKTKADPSLYKDQENKLLAENEKLITKYQKLYKNDINKEDIDNLRKSKKTIEEKAAKEKKSTNNDPFAFDPDEFEKPQKNKALEIVESKIKLVKEYQNNLEKLKNIPDKIESSKKKFEEFTTEKGDIDQLKSTMQRKEQVIYKFLKKLNFTEIEKTSLVNHGLLQKDTFIQNFTGVSGEKPRKRGSEVLGKQKEKSSDSAKKPITTNESFHDVHIELGNTAQTFPDLDQQKAETLKFIFSETAKENEREKRVSKIARPEKKWASTEKSGTTSMKEVQNISSLDKTDESHKDEDQAVMPMRNYSK